MKTTDLSLAVIRTDGGTQMRVELDSDVYLDYRDKWLAGEKFDPIDVFHDGAAYWLADGFHRFYGAREAKLKAIPARVHNGTVRDAILFACGANAAHGLRRTNADKRRAVETLLNDEEWVKWSDNKLAEKAAVSQQTVSRIRKELTQSVSCNHDTPEVPRIGRDGKRRKAPKKRTKPVVVAPVEDPEPEPEASEPDEEPHVPPPDRTVFSDLRRLFEQMTLAERATAMELWDDWMSQ